MKLPNYVAGQCREGAGDGEALIDPVTGVETRTNFISGRGRRDGSGLCALSTWTCTPATFVSRTLGTVGQNRRGYDRESRRMLPNFTP